MVVMMVALALGGAGDVLAVAFMRLGMPPVLMLALFAVAVLPLSAVLVRAAPPPRGLATALRCLLWTAPLRFHWRRPFRSKLCRLHLDLGPIRLGIRTHSCEHLWPWEKQ